MVKVKLRFGPAGMPIAMKGKSLVEGVKYCIKRGLYAFEVEWVRGVRIKKGIENDLKKVVEENDVLLSAHAPYWINPCSSEERIKQITLRNLKQCAKAANLLNIQRVVFHPGYYGKQSQAEAMKNAIELLKDFFDWQEEEGLKVIFAAETTGKKSQFGNLLEVINLSKKFNLIIPCIDFAHLHARDNGAIKNEEDYERIINIIKEELGKKVLENLHVHFSGIKYGEKGEREHLPIDKAGPNYKKFLNVILKNNYAFNIVCESPLLDLDAERMLNYVKRINKNKGKEK